ncbi:MAG: transposase [Armatimonadetes bacterium]|nr:transposase [Armatimonadota bacterium]
MEQERNGSPEQTARARKDAELFVHLRLETVGTAPWLADEDVAQAALTAVTARAKEHRCRVLAVGNAVDHLHAVLRFPASLPLNLLARVVREASAQAVARALQVLGEADAAPEAVWSRHHALDTLSATDVAAVAAYVHCHPQSHAPDTLRPEWERAGAALEGGQRPSWNYFVRGRPHKYRRQ